MAQPPRMQHPPDGTACHQQHTHLDEQLLGVDPIDRPVLQLRVGQQTVDEERHGGGVRRVVQLLPAVEPEYVPKVRREDGKGHGATVRYVTLPNEAHGYAARETLLHVLAERITWFDKYVKHAQPRTTTEAAR